MPPLSQSVGEFSRPADSVRRVTELNPIVDPRWSDFVEAHPHACAFHTVEWLKALNLSYGYEPFVLTSTPPGQDLTDGMVCCKVRSWLTGSRIVSLPFSDHCDPLVKEPSALTNILQHLRQLQEAGTWKYVELRPLPEEPLDLLTEGGYSGAGAHCFHTLDLSPSIDEILSGFNRKSVRHVLKRAERENLVIEEGTTREHLHKFYSLMILTRRRHGLPPQPMAWFRNLLNCMGAKVSIRVASKGSRPIASILTLTHNRIVIYKYACSDPAFHNLGGTVLLLFHAIRDAKAAGALKFDLGRSDLDNPGLILFKSHFGAQSSPLTYYRFPGDVRAAQSGKSGLKAAGKALAMLPDRSLSKISRKVISRLPNRVLPVIGSVLYRHIG